MAMSYSRVTTRRTQATMLSRVRLSSLLGRKPMTWATGSPPLKTRSVGMLRMPYLDAVWMLSSVLSLTNLTRPLYSSASSSTRGETMRQGPHQGAQKSTSTGRSLSSTWASQSLSVTSAGLLMRPPRGSLFGNLAVLTPLTCRWYYTPEGDVNEQTRNSRSHPGHRADPGPPPPHRGPDPRHPQDAGGGPRLRGHRNAVDGGAQRPGPGGAADHRPPHRPLPDLG